MWKLYQWPLLLTLDPNGGMRFAFPPYSPPGGDGRHKAGHDEGGAGRDVV